MGATTAILSVERSNAVLAIDTPDEVAGMLIAMGFYGGLGSLYLYTGMGLRRFRPSARIIASIFSGLGLAAIPIGTRISAYFLY